MDKYKPRELTLQFEIVCATDNQYELWKSILHGIETALQQRPFHKKNVITSFVTDIVADNLTEKKK